MHLEDINRIAQAYLRRYGRPAGHELATPELAAANTCMAWLAAIEAAGFKVVPRQLLETSPEPRRPPDEG